MGLFGRKNKPVEPKDPVISMNPTTDIIVPEDFDGNDVNDELESVKPAQPIQKQQPKSLEQEKAEIMAKLKAIAEQEEAASKAEEERKQQEIQAQQPQQTNVVDIIMTRITNIESRLFRAGL